MPTNYVTPDRNLLSLDEEVFANSQLWKSLLSRTCTVKLWEGDRAGRRVQVWGGPPPF